MTTRPAAMYSQYRTFNHVYLFKSSVDQSLTLKIFDTSQKMLTKLTLQPPAFNASQLSKMETPSELLNLFIQHKLLTPDYIPSIPKVDYIHELEQMILQAKAKTSVETENMKQFTCPITLEVFEEPVIDDHGHTFEKSAIEKHLKKNGRCPFNRQPIASLTPNRNIKDAIEVWKKQDPIPTFALFKKNNPVLFGKNLETAQLYVEQEEYDEALESYAKAFIYTNDWKNYQEVPKLFEKINNPEKALLAYLYLALYQLQDGKKEDAIKTLEQCKEKSTVSQLLISLYHATKQPNQAINLAYERAEELEVTAPTEAIRLYKQLLTFDPSQWNAYTSLSALTQDPQEKGHILLKGACQALEAKEYSTAKKFSQEAERLYPDSFLDRLIEFNPSTPPSRDRLLQLAKTYEQKNLIAPMVKAYKMLTQLEYNPTYYKKIVTHIPNPGKTKWTLRWLTASMEKQDWESAEQVALQSLKATKEPLLIYQKLEIIYTNWHGHELCNLWSQLGQEFVKTNQLDLAERTYKKAYERFETLDHALALGEVLLKQNKKTESVEVYYNASQDALLGKNPEALDLCLKNIRQIDPSMSSLTKAQKIDVLRQTELIELTTQVKELKEQLNSLKVAPIAAAPTAPVLPSIAFGAAEWKKYFGDVGIEPPLPSDINAILSSPCPFCPGKKVSDTHLLVLIPQTVSGQRLTMKSLGELVKNPLKGTATQYSYCDLGEYTDTATPKSHWALLTRAVVEGSRKKTYTDQKSLIKAPYEVPTILDATVAIFMELVRTGTKLYSERPITYTRCQEKYNTNYQLVVGGFSASGVCVYSYFGDDRGDCGVGGLRKF